jgi:hypothetical protein
MRTFIAMSLGLSLFAAVPAYAKGKTPAASAAKIDRAKIVDHLAKHQTYPATKQQLVESCNGLVDFSAEEKKWFAEQLPDATYKSAADVQKALKI